MKIVFQIGKTTKVKKIKDYELHQVIHDIKAKYEGFEIEPLRYEVFRYKLRKGAIVIYKDNKVLKTRNEWFEFRALSALAKTHGRFKHAVKFEKEGYQTEVDGVSIENDFLVEIKRDRINQQWVDFYQEKMEKLNYKQLFLIAASFQEDLNIPDSITPIKFKPDWNNIRRHYENFKFPEWIEDAIPHRHIRFLLPNGKWKGARRKLTKTAKHTPESKFTQAINWLKFWMPAKIYYTMSRMVNPPAEYYGKGYPMSKLLAVFDIDSDAHEHVIGTQGYCEQCIKESREKLKLASEILLNEGHALKTVFSGKKGFHIYITEEDKAIEVDQAKLLEILEKIKDLSDSATFKGKNEEFDVHRIIKVPNTIDATTGMLVKEGLTKLDLKDELIFL